MGRIPRDDELERLSAVKRLDHRTGVAIGPELIHFFKQSVEKPHAKLGKIADCWQRLIPDTLSEHCALEGFVRGTLTVIVDSSSHLYELKQLLLAGMQQQLLIACKSAGLRKINVRHGRWYDAGEEGGKKLRFD